MRLIKRIAFCFVALLLIIGATAWWAYRQAQQVPEFYERAVERPSPERLAASSEKLMSEVRQLQQDVETPGQWQATFAADEVNAWLADQLPKKLPRLKAKGLRNPRIAIEEDRLLFAAHYKDRRIDAIISCELSVRLTDQPNRLAVTVHNIRAGALPLPLNQFQSKIDRATSKTKLNLRWEAQEDETVALIDVLGEYADQVNDDVVIEWIELTENLLTVAGRTQTEQDDSFEPRGVVYRIAQSPRSGGARDTSLDGVDL
ncbi:MAG: hypothetical protein AAFU85_28050 [Planctomycetota bacterium]